MIVLAPTTSDWDDRAKQALEQWLLLWSPLITHDARGMVTMAFYDGYAAGVRDAQKEQVEALDG